MSQMIYVRGAGALATIALLAKVDIQDSWQEGVLKRASVNGWTAPEGGEPMLVNVALHGHQMSDDIVLTTGADAREAIGLMNDIKENNGDDSNQAKIGKLASASDEPALIIGLCKGTIKIADQATVQEEDEEGQPHR